MGVGMVSEACQQYMQHVDAAAVHSGPAQDVLSILEADQQAAEVQLLINTMPSALGNLSALVSP